MYIDKYKTKWADLRLKFLREPTISMGFRDFCSEGKQVCRFSVSCGKPENAKAVICENSK